MKKTISIALLCVSLFTVAMVSTNASTHSTFPTTISCADDDLGPSVALNITAYTDNRPTTETYIKIDVYRAKNLCDSYVAYISGTTTRPMAVLKNPNYKSKNSPTRYGYHYYVSYNGCQYFFDL